MMPRPLSRHVIRSLGLLTALFIPSALAAQTQAPECGTIKIDSMNNYFMQYRTDATFPEEPKRLQVDFLPGKPTKALSACGMTVSFDGNKLEIHAATLDDLLGVWTRGKAFLYVPEVRAALQTYLQIDPQARTIGEDYFSPTSADDLTVIGVRIDNGPLQKLLYKSVMTPVTYPETARLINVYTGNTHTNRIQVARMQLDLARTTLTTWYTSDFPQK